MSLVGKIKSTEEKVTWLLRKYPDMRDDDKILCTNFWAMEISRLGKEYETLSFTEFGELYMSGKLTNHDIITRARRRVTENNPELRGKNYTERKRQEESVREEIRG